MKRIVTAFMVVFCFQSVTYASSVFVTAEGGWANQFGLPNRAIVKATRVRINSFPVGRFGVGYVHNLTARFGVGIDFAEGFYSTTYYHFNNAPEISINSRTMEFMAVFMTYFDKLSINAEIGGIRHITKNKSTKRTIEETRIQPEIIAGANYNIFSRLALSLNYLHAFGQRIVNIENPDWEAPSLNALLAGVRITFT